MFRKKNLNEPLHLFITKGDGTSKTFTLMLLIQGLLHFYNKNPQLNPSKEKHYSWHTLEKWHLTQFIQVKFLLIVKIFHL
jgi:hypothetical protein